ncbi:MAG: hypothetical protein BWX87_02568 [Bacteroidetes bacterium ADurb.Bin123]|nr:MAG: hypothetical protein BWX87_02568 [Bacteroidetes bacterium ADurb.Bin123]
MKKGKSNNNWNIINRVYLQLSLLSQESSFSDIFKYRTLSMKVLIAWLLSFSEKKY